MELKTCEYCGTSFDASLRQCPLCGKAVEPSPAEPIILNAGGEPAAPRRREKGGKRLAKNRVKPLFPLFRVKIVKYALFLMDYPQPAAENVI